MGDSRYAMFLVFLCAETRFKLSDIVEKQGHEGEVNALLRRTVQWNELSHRLNTRDLP